MAEAEFYVYVHRRADTGEVFYVGKGRGNRAWQLAGRNKHWNCIARARGFVVEIVRDGLQEWAAFEHEAELIALYGRKDCGYGPLTNTTDGGEGCSGTIFTSAMREQIARRQLGDWNVSKRADVKEKLSLLFTGPRNPMYKPGISAKVAEKNKGRVHSHEARRNMSEAQKGKVFSEETRKRISMSKMGSKHPLFGKSPSAEYRQKISEALKVSLAARGKIEITEATRKKISEAQTLRWAKHRANK
jgi:hypothetical protein